MFGKYLRESTNMDSKLKMQNVSFFLKFRYFGQIIDQHRRRPDPERATAIRNMPAPENVSTLQSFLSLANYYNVFIPSMHNLSAPLNE